MCACAVIHFTSEVLFIRSAMCICVPVESLTEGHEFRDLFFLFLCQIGPRAFWVPFFIYFNEQNLSCDIWPNYANQITFFKLCNFYVCQVKQQCFCFFLNKIQGWKLNKVLPWTSFMIKVWITRKSTIEWGYNYSSVGTGFRNPIMISSIKSEYSHNTR